MIKSLFLDHPASVDESYLEHLNKAGTFGLRLVAAGLACTVHAVLPCVFEHTASRAVEALHDEMARRRGLAQTPQPARGDVARSALH